MKLFVLLFIGIIQFSDEKPTTTSDATTTGIPDDESSIVTEFALTPELEDEVKTISSTDNEKTINNSSEVHEPPKEVQLPVDLLSDDILLDPSVILARAERSVRSIKTEKLYGPIGDSLNVGDGIPTLYFLRFVRVPRSAINHETESEKTGLFQKPEEPDETRKRFSRNAEEKKDADLNGADDGFIVRPLFKYRHEQLKSSKTRRYRNRDTYLYYPRYPVFPGK